MHRTDGDSNVSNMFDPGDISAPRYPTQCDSTWLNAIQEELVNVILTRAGITLVKGLWTQLGSALDFLYASNVPPGGRLTLTTGVPVTTAGVIAVNTVYYTPYKSDRIQLYTGTGTFWKWYTFTELSQLVTDTTKSPAAGGVSLNYDMFVWDDAGTLRCTRGPAWTSATARGTGAGTTELEMFGGRYVNKVAITNGPALRRGLYVGSVRTLPASTFADGPDARFVWNNYNRVWRSIQPNAEATDSWAYSTATWRQANNAAANRLDFLVGLSEDCVSAQVRACVTSNTSGGGGYTGIGLDSTTAPATGCLIDQSSVSGTATGVFLTQGAAWKGFPGIGFHILTWLEKAIASGTVTWYGDNAGTMQSGIVGDFLA